MYEEIDLDVLAENVSEHFGHKVVAVTYKNDKDNVNFAIECEDCCLVITDYEL